MLCQFVLYNQVNQSHICIYPLPLETPSSPTHHTLLWDMLLCSFQVYRKAVWLYMCVCVCVCTRVRVCMYSFFKSFPLQFITRYLSQFLCMLNGQRYVIQQIWLFIQFMYSSVQLLIPYSQFIPIHHFSRWHQW